MKKWSIQKTYKLLMVLRKMNEDWKSLHRKEKSNNQPKIYYRNVASKKQMKKAVILVLVTLFAFGIYLALITKGLAAILFFPVTIYASLIFSLPKALTVLGVLVLYNCLVFLYNRYRFQPKRMKKGYSKIYRRTKELSIVPEELFQVETIQRMLEVSKKRGVSDEKVVRWFQLMRSKGRNQKSIRKAMN